MAERVATGGLKTFHYGRDHSPKLDEERKKEIRDAYEHYYERKRRERTKRIMIITLIIIAILVTIFFAAAFLRSS